MEKLDVILPAGGQLDDHFARVALTQFKPLIKVQDGVVGLRSIMACQLSGLTNRLILIGTQDVQDSFRSMVTTTLKDTGDLAKNVSMAIRELKSQGGVSSRVLILTTDLPYMDEKVLQKYVEMCPEEADIAVPLITKEEYLDRFPSATGTFANLTDGEFTIGCAYLIKPDVFLRIFPQIEQVVANRKNITKLAKLLGLKFVWKVATRSISSVEVKTKVEEVIGCKVVAVRGAPAELAFDIDDIVDYEYALRNK